MNESEKRNQAELRRYAVQQALANQEFIAPELMDFATIGDSAEAIDKSIERAKEKSAQIVQRARGMAQPLDVDPAWRQDQVDGISDTPPLSADVALAAQVASWDMATYARERARLGIHKSTQDFLAGA